MAETMPLVAERVGRRYRRGRPWAIRDIDLAIPRGSIAALVGPNGAGKSTLIRSWMGFERPDEGRVLVEGVDVGRDRTAAVRLVGYVPQAAALYRSLTVDDHFRFAAAQRPGFDRPHARDRARAAGVGLDRTVGELSGGEQAQVALAIALATRSPVLILDEPLASLDPLARREFLRALIDDVRSTGATAILSSHIVSDVEQACDWVVVLATGRVALATAVASARSEHRTVRAADLDGRSAIGHFLGPDGTPLALLRSDEPTLRESTVEEVVLGHLAARRRATTGPGDPS
jgi:ABC-2 type transport system ATP-binding protein